MPSSQYVLRPRTLVILPILTVLILSTILAVRTPTAHATLSEYISEERGFDDCKTPTTSQMSAWWVSSPYYNYFVYLGGSNRSNCGGAALTSSWITTVTESNNSPYNLWSLVWIWVGPQMPYSTCQTHNRYNNYVSTNTTTAYNQGYSEATSAVSALSNLGVNINNAPIAYDLEYYNNVSSCRAAAKSFMKGWADYLQIAPAQLSGGYGSACASFVDDWASDGNPPDFVWPGGSYGGMSTGTIQCVSSSHWTNHQRHKQYTGGGNDGPYGGVTLNIDKDCSNGPVDNNGVVGTLEDGTCL